MKFDGLLQRVGENGIFTTGQILAGERSPADLRRQLNRWVKAGRVVQLRRGVYMLSEAYAKQRAHPFVVANLLKKASYVSLQSALSHYGMIPEYVPVTTSVTTGRPEELSNPVGRFQYRHVDARCFLGFREVEIAPGQVALLATPGKALIDLFYLTPRCDDAAFLHELRITPPDDFDASEFVKGAQACGSGKVERAATLLVGMWKEG